MNKKKWAAKLNGREVGEEFRHEEHLPAKNDNVVIVYGDGDDEIEFRGAIDDELTYILGERNYFLDKEILKNDCDSEECPYFEAAYDRAVKENKWIEPTYYHDDYESEGWCFQVPFDHETFEIMKEGVVFCTGVVFSKNSLTYDWRYENMRGSVAGCRACGYPKLEYGYNWCPACGCETEK